MWLTRDRLVGVGCPSGAWLGLWVGGTWFLCMGLSTGWWVPGAHSPKELDGDILGNSVMSTTHLIG